MTDNMTPQTSQKTSDEEVLNVLRRDERETLTTPEIVEELPIGDRATQKKVKRLEKNGRLVLDRSGNANRWRLAETEPREPVYHPQIAQAKRTRAKAYDLGDRIFMPGLGLVAAAGLAMAYHVFFLIAGVSVPLLSNSALPLSASLFGLLGSLCFISAFAAKVYGYIIPKWQINRIKEQNE